MRHFKRTGFCRTMEENGKIKTVLCYGDSNTWGYMPETDGRFPWEVRWPGILQRRLGESYRVIENGICGRTTQFDSFREKFVNGYTGAEECVLMNTPLDMVIVMLGTNDCKDFYGAEPEEIGQGLENVGKLFSQSGADVCILSPPPLKGIDRSPFRNEFGNEAEEKSRKLSGIFREVSERNHWEFMDTAFIIETGTFDGIHMTKEAHRKLGYEAVAWIKKKEETYGK